MSPTLMIRSVIVCAAFLAVSFGLAMGQLTLPTLEWQQFDGSTMVWLSPKAGQAVHEGDLFSQPGIADYFGDYDEMVLLKVRQGEGGIIHRRYQQRHAGYEVEGAVFATHEKDGLLRVANGQLAPLPEVVEEPSVTDLEAVYIVQARLGMLGPVASEGDDYIVPRVDLIYAPTSWETGGALQEYRLAYRIGMVVVEPYSSTTSYVDAHTGAIFRLESATMECSAGNGSTLYNGWQATTTKLYNFLGTHYELRDECQGDLIHTRIDNHLEHYQTFYKHSRCDEVKDGDNIWTAPEDQAAVSLHWAAEMYWDYLDVKLGRDGLDGNGATMKLVYHPTVLRVYLPNNGNNPDTIVPFNAKWESDFDECHFGRGDGISPWVSLDIVAHELTHGLMDLESSGMLTGGNEAHALGESFADIFSVCCEAYVMPLHDPNRLPNFTLGEDVAHGPIRSMSEPWLFSSPHAYQGPGWLYPPNDEPHQNSSVQTYWFYLLSYGSAGNPVEPNTSVCGIGMDNAVQIAYKSVQDYFVVGATHFDARQATVQAAIDVFGLGSFEAMQCANAWAAVAVGSGSDFCNPTTSESANIGPSTGMIVFPNPASSEFNVSLDLTSNVINGNLTLWSASGVKVADIPVPIRCIPKAIDCVVNCRDIPAGTYNLLFSCKDRHICRIISIIH